MGHQMLLTEFCPDRPLLPWQQNLRQNGLYLGLYNKYHIIRSMSIGPREAVKYCSLRRSESRGHGLVITGGRGLALIPQISREASTLSPCRREIAAS